MAERKRLAAAESLKSDSANAPGSESGAGAGPGAGPGPGPGAGRREVWLRPGAQRAPPPRAPDALSTMTPVEVSAKGIRDEPCL